MAKDKLKQKIITALRKGTSTETIVKRLKVSSQTVGAYRAHMTMGTYR